MQVRWDMRADRGLCRDLAGPVDSGSRTAPVDQMGQLFEILQANRRFDAPVSVLCLDRGNVFSMAR